VGYPVLFVDEAGKRRQVWTDGFGRVIEADEVDGNGAMTQNTCYTYDVLNNLTSAVVPSVQTRIYSYDGLSRLKSVATPESGGCATSYSYDANGNLISRVAPKPNQASCTTTVTTTYMYDALDRLTSRTYNDSMTPSAYFAYDETGFTLNGTTYTLTNTKGRLSHTWTENAQGVKLTRTIYSYDLLGRVQDYWECTPTNCASPTFWKMHYAYDLAGNVATWSHPDNFTITQNMSTAERIASVTSSRAGAPSALATLTYTPWGAISTLVNGCTGTGCTQRKESYDYNSRLQPTRVQLGTSTTPAANYCLVYNYYPVANPTTCISTPGTAASGNNGDVTGYYYSDANVFFPES